MTDKEKEAVDAMSRLELCRRWRFEPTSSAFWQGEHGDYAEARLKALGGFSPEISKAIGWSEGWDG